MATVATVIAAEKLLPRPEVTAHLAGGIAIVGIMVIIDWQRLKSKSVL